MKYDKVQAKTINNTSDNQCKRHEARRSDNGSRTMDDEEQDRNGRSSRNKKRISDCSPPRPSVPLVVRMLPLS